MKRRKTKKVKMVKVLGETVRKGSKRHGILLSERRHFLERQRDPNSSYYGVPISELLKSNRRRTKRCWKGYSPVKGMRPYSKGSCRKVRMNKMRSRNSMGQKLYVVITADGAPLSGRIGTLNPPGPILYTKGEAIKKGRMFRGRVVSVENYYKMRPGLRRNGADHKRHRWQIFGYDVWGNAEDGWDVNDVLPGPVITMSYKAEYDKKTFDSAMSRAGFNLRWALIDNGASDEDTIYFNTASGKPLAEMRRVK